MKRNRQLSEKARKPMTKSERAELQPRDSNGRFAGFDTVMVIDEFGNPGILPKKSETKFGYAVSVTEKPDAFGEITSDNRWASSIEKKARDDVVKQFQITSRIASQGTRTYAYYVDKEKPPRGWDSDDRRAVMLKMLSSSVDKTLPEVRGNVYVVVDQHTAYKKDIPNMMRSKSRPWKTVDGDKFDSHEGPCADLLQTHDYVANAVRGDIEVRDCRRTRILKTKIRRIEGDDLVG